MYLMFPVSIICDIQFMPTHMFLVSHGIRASPTSQGSNTWNGGLWSGGLDPMRGANRDQHSRDQQARSGSLWSGGLDPKRVPTVTNIAVTNEDIGSSKGGVIRFYPTNPKPSPLTTRIMTGSDIPKNPTPLSKKLSLVTYHHLLMRVPVKLDLDNWNYGSWEFFFEELCSTYDVDKYIRTHPTKSSTSSSTPLTPEELKVDNIVLSWILFTLFDSFFARLVMTCPKSAKEAWGLISDIVKDNKRSRTKALKAELRSIKLGDQSMESYFQKIDFIVNILTSLDARVNDEEVVHYALEGLPDTYNQVCVYMHWKDTFLDLKTVRSLLITEEMRLKSQALALPADSSSLMGTCRFGDLCRYVHDVNAKPVTNTSGSTPRGRGTVDTTNTTNELLINPLAAPGLAGPNGSYHPFGPPGLYHSHGPTAGPMHPPGFHVSAQQTGNPYHELNPLQAIPSQPMISLAQPSTATSPIVTQPANIGSITLSGHATILPHAFNAKILQDPNSGAWNMYICASSHLNSSSTCLSDVFSTCLYLSVSVGDGHSIPITNMGHSVLPTSYGPFHLNNVLITPNIVKNLISVRQFVRDTNCTVEFDAFSFLRTSQLVGCCSDVIVQGIFTQSLFLLLSHMLSLPVNIRGINVLDIQELGKHVRLLFVSSDTVISSCFDNIHSDVWTSPILSLSGYKYYPIHQLDVNNAFLYDDLSETVYMHQPPGFRDYVYPDYVCLLQRSLYGIKQAPKLGFRGSLQYLTFTRPNISYAVQRVCLFMHDPRKPHFSALKRIMRYVRGTLDYGLQLFSFSTLDLVAYSDADWAGFLTTRRLTSGYCVFLGNNLPSYSSKRQPTLSHSSAEVEYRGVANVVAETCWLRNLLRELHTPLTFAILVYCDNVSAVYLSCNPVQHQRTKYIEIDIHFVRDLVVVGQVRVLHVPSCYQFADIFTKGLPSALFEGFCSNLTVHCPLAQTAGEC
ncbi:ribonuclease H-like domain-containing protein [Tanacetum coccineum]